MHPTSTRSPLSLWILAAALAITAIVYWPGLQGGFLFDDYPNIVDNQGVQPHDASLPSLVRAALASPASEFKRPLASLSFAANYLATGIDPYWMKLTNLVLHLLNGLLVFLLTKLLFQSVSTEDQPRYSDVAATLVAAGWMLLPINLTAVLYVVQRMESIANLFVLLGLIGYVTGRRRMLAPAVTPSPVSRGGVGRGHFSSDTRGLTLCLISITVPTAIGILAKETAVMLPLYALLIEWTLFRFYKPQEPIVLLQEGSAMTWRRDFRVICLFLLVLVTPMVIGLAWLLPGILRPETWAARDFTLSTRLLSEARIVVDYVTWTLLPTPDALSFYHDDFQISTGLLTPWTTLVSIATLAALVAMALWLRSHRPLVALGIALFLGCQLLTGTILPLELIYEHRNYFASFGLLLAITPLLAVPRGQPFALSRHVLLAGLLLCWAALTAMTAYAWGNPLRLAEDLASRAPQSPRAQYELGRTYIIYSHYEPTSPFTSLAYAPLEKAAALPDSSILPEQALIFMNARMHLPLKDVWWDSLTMKLKAHKPGVQDESSLGALTQCAREHSCSLPTDRMMQAFMAALSHPNPSARLLATYGDYAWNVLDDHALGERMTVDAVKASPNEPAYQITLVRMLVAQGRIAEADKVLQKLGALNIGGRLNDSLNELHALQGLQIDAAVKPD
jgi:protein O-mannosyl-transferase